jgi:hypothetical protein
MDLAVTTLPSAFTIASLSEDLQRMKVGESSMIIKDEE